MKKTNTLFCLNSQIMNDIQTLNTLFFFITQKFQFTTTGNKSTIPINATDNYTGTFVPYNVTGYRHISINADRKVTNGYLSGLLVSSYPCTYIDGCPGCYSWYYSIGRFQNTNIN